MVKQSGYYRFPSISGNQVVFVCEDDLWSVPLDGGIAIRLTANLGAVSRPFLSPNGTLLAFVGKEEGNAEVYCVSAEGGAAKRLTFLGGNVAVIGWSRDGQSILFASNAAQPFRHIYNLYAISPAGGSCDRLPVGLAHSISYAPQKGVVLGRNTADPARWKRYRGGTVGVLWIDADESGNFHPLIHLNGNLTAPMWVGDRIYFISDHDGIGNLYSCTPQGEDLTRHTYSAEYYIRNASTDGQRIVYQAGAELCCFDPATASNHPIQVQFHSPQVQRQRKFVDAGEFLEDYDLHPDGHSTLVVTRGKSFYFGNWEGAVIPIGHSDQGRYRLTRWLKDKNRLITVSDRSGLETLEILSPEFNTPPDPLTGLDIGRVRSLQVSPVADQIALTNHRHELILVDLETRQSRILDHSDYANIQGFDWSPDGQWLAYSCAETQMTFSIKVCRIADGTTHCLTPPRFRDFSPSFDPDGKFIYFISLRDFNPVYDSIYFDLNFPKGMRPFLIALQKDVPSPFIPLNKPLESDAANSNGTAHAKNAASTAITEAEVGSERHEASMDDKDAKLPTPIEIDFDGIAHRILAFPVPEGRYRQIWGLKGKVLFSSMPVRGSLDQQGSATHPDAKTMLEIYDFSEQKQEKLATDITNFKVAKDYETLIYRTGNRLRVCAIASMKPDKPQQDAAPGRKSGWLNLDRVRVSVVPPKEWQQMFREIWRLQKEHFWTENLSGVDWNRVYKRYTPLLEKVATRSEFSDLIWEIQGELGTSHAYEFGGDYRDEPDYQLGFLGADFVYDASADAYRIQHIVKGDSWNEKTDSPLNQLGINIQEGDLLLAVSGQRLSQYLSPQELLVHQAGCEVALTVASNAQAEPRTVTVKTLKTESYARYREWVETKHRQVSEATGGQIGYVHIPDMSAYGYAEFHRYYFAELHKKGLIVDVRFNGGGHVSQLLLEKLIRKRVGYDISRWGKPDPYPSDSVMGPLVAVTNEYAGSDGDIFSHCFKLMNVGTLIGKRTWGGVIGISPSHVMVDRTVTTQPEYSFWFVDVGWGVENYGTDPDIEVDISPQDWAQGNDPQLDRAIQVILEELESNPVHLPDFSDRPHLPLP